MAIRVALVPCCILMTLLLAQSCASSKKQADPIAELKQGIEKHVSDPARATTMTAAIDDLERVIGDLGALNAQQQDTLTPLLHDYGSSRESIETTLAGYNARREPLARRAIEALVAFKSAATAEEWKQLRKLEEAALSHAAQQTLGQQALIAKED